MIGRARKVSDAWPNIPIKDVVSEGVLNLYRHPAGKSFLPENTIRIEATWATPDLIDAALLNVQLDACDISKEHPFLWNADFGFITPVPSVCGTGLSIAAVFHLEGLNLLGDLPATLNALSAMRYSTESFSRDDIKQMAHLFRVRNLAVLGITEEDLKARVRRVYAELINQEINARKRLVMEMPLVFADAVDRALGVFKSARLLASGEVIDILSPIRLAAQMGFLENLTREDVAKIMVKCFRAMPAPRPQTLEEEIARDKQDAHLAMRIKKRFEKVRFTAEAESILAL